MGEEAHELYQGGALVVQVTELCSLSIFRAILLCSPTILASLKSMALMPCILECCIAGPGSEGLCSKGRAEQGGGLL